MAQVAGIYYGTNTANCRELNSTACTTAGYNYSATYNCYNSGGSYQLPKACLIGTVDPCPTSSSSVAVDWSINSLEVSTVAYLFTGSLLMWVVGLGIGLLIAQVRKTRIR